MSFTLNQVSFRYPTALSNELSLKDVTAELPDGEVIVLLGPSGCGKTTLLNLLALLWEEKIDSGQIVYRDGHEVFNYDEVKGNPDLRVRLRRDHFGTILQNCYLLSHVSCLHNICLPLVLRGWSETEQVAWAESLIRKADTHQETRNGEVQNDLFGARLKMPRQVSLGQKQRIAVLRAVAANPRVVFADEPISNLDRTSTHAILQLLLDWQTGHLHRDCAAKLLDGQKLAASMRERLSDWLKPDPHPRTLLLVCHDLAIAKQCADRALLFDENHRLIGVYTPDRWTELDAQLNALLKIQSIRKPRP